MRTSYRKLATLGAAALLMTGFVAVASADADDPPGRVARLNYINGGVSFQPAGVDDWVAAPLNRPITTGDRLWVDDSSRAELHIGTAAIRLAARTGFSFMNLDDYTTQIRLSEGMLEVRLRRLDDNEVFEVDTPNLALSLLRPGDYRISVNEDGTETNIVVHEGEGEVTGGGQAFTVRRRQSVQVWGTDQLNYDLGGAPPPDGFDDWCMQRNDREERSQSARYVSRDVIGYEDLDENGTWRNDPDYGSVWVPRTVVAGWAPYRYGHWAWVDPWGWTWVDDAPWGFAPFHYGRWAYINGYWGWVPGPVVVRPVYAPALVAWVGGRNWGVGVSFGGGAGVGWIPLGPREVYVPAYRASRTYVNQVNVTNTTVTNVTINNYYNNVNNTTIVNRNVRYVNQSAPGALTAMPQQSFASGRPVYQSAMSVSPSAVQGATYATAPPVAPNRASVLGGTANSNASVARPPMAAVNRPVVARTAPPPAPVPFAARQQQLQAQPGQPLDRQALEQVRQSQPRPMVQNIRPAVPNNAAPVRVSPPVNSSVPSPVRPTVRPPDRPLADRPMDRQPNPRPLDRPQDRPVERPAVVPPPTQQPRVDRPVVTPPPRVERPQETPRPEVHQQAPPPPRPEIRQENRPAPPPREKTEPKREEHKEKRERDR